MGVDAGGNPASRRRGEIRGYRQSRVRNSRRNARAREASEELTLSDETVPGTEPPAVAEFQVSSEAPAVDESSVFEISAEPESASPPVPAVQEESLRAARFRVAGRAAATSSACRGRSTRTASRSQSPTSAASGTATKAARAGI